MRDIFIEKQLWTTFSNGHPTFKKKLKVPAKANRTVNCKSTSRGPRRKEIYTAIGGGLSSYQGYAYTKKKICDGRGEEPNKPNNEVD